MCMDIILLIFNIHAVVGAEHVWEWGATEGGRKFYGPGNDDSRQSLSDVGAAAGNGGAALVRSAHAFFSGRSELYAERGTGGHVVHSIGPGGMYLSLYRIFLAQDFPEERGAVS